ncbi:uncharacterized protein LOC117649172 [Thrips palmi]|uniref:Uncharacterized protein LOC117649172 n=1 Tax=Thrips palmi TaxID=161013 RepID=A0A6P8ZRG3_THRPL|nr:uncharacterized protein LOC117649172 [Thrips palmi]
MSKKLVTLDCAMTPEFLAVKLNGPVSMLDAETCSSQVCPRDRCGSNLIVLTANTQTLLRDGIEQLERCIHDNMVFSTSQCMQPFKDGLNDICGDPDYVTNFPPDPTFSKYVLCSGVVEHVYTMQQTVLISIPGVGNERCGYEYESQGKGTATFETTYKCRLSQIPISLDLLGTTYTLRGAIGFNAPYVASRRYNFKKEGELGHYVTFSRRIGGSWQIFDDLRTKHENLKTDKVISVCMLLYTM